VIARVLRTIDTKAARPYELLLLSDHGQSFGFTFKQRYGMDLKGYLESLLPHGTSVSQSMGGDDGAMSVASMSAELTNMQEQQVGGRIGKSVVKQTSKALDRVNAQTAPALDAPANITVCGSGNIAQVYFDLAKRKLTYTELNQAYPGMLDQLVAHEGIGFVVAYNDDCVPLVFGKMGARNLHTGEVTGDDPLKPYGDPKFRAAQVRRIADFPNSGDLIVNSTIYPDGTVAAMEELIGNHGGLGGEQTDAFILHPASMPIPVTSNSADVFHILNGRRGIVPPPAKPIEKPKAIDSWTPSTLIKGIAAVGAWAGLAIRSALLNRDAYRRVAKDPLMTGPALLIAILAGALQLLVRGTPITVGSIVLTFASIFIVVLGAYLAARLLRGKANYTETFRVFGFSQMVYVLALLAVIPGYAPAVRFIVAVIALIAIWVAVSEAHGILGWRTLLLPFLSVLLLTAMAVAIQLLVTGTQLSIEALLRTFGLVP
jgi:hypothetical protein